MSMRQRIRRPYDCRRSRICPHMSVGPGCGPMSARDRDISSYDCKESRCPYEYRGMYVHVDMPLYGCMRSEYALTISLFSILVILSCFDTRWAPGKLWKQEESLSGGGIFCGLKTLSLSLSAPGRDQMFLDPLSECRFSFVCCPA